MLGRVGRVLLAWQGVVLLALLLAQGAGSCRGAARLSDADARWLASVLEPTDADLSRARLAARGLGAEHRRASERWAAIVASAGPGARGRARLVRALRDAPDDLPELYVRLNERMVARASRLPAERVAIELGQLPGVEELPPDPDPPWGADGADYHERWRALLRASASGPVDPERLEELSGFRMGPFLAAELELRWRRLREPQRDRERAREWLRLAELYRPEDAASAAVLARAAAATFARVAPDGDEAVESRVRLAAIVMQLAMEATDDWQQPPTPRARALLTEVVERSARTPAWADGVFSLARLLEAEGDLDGARDALSLVFTEDFEESLGPPGSPARVQGIDDRRHEAAVGLAELNRRDWNHPMALVWEGRALRGPGPAYGGQPFPLNAVYRAPRLATDAVLCGPVVLLAVLPAALGPIGWAMLAASLLGLALIWQGSR